MSLIKRMRRQRAIYWAFTGELDHYGRPSFLPPIEIHCRWVDESQELRSPQGTIVNFSSKVYVDRVMKIGEFLKRGELESNTSDDPTSESDTHMIQRFDQLPNLRATETLLTALL